MPSLKGSLMASCTHTHRHVYCSGLFMMVVVVSLEGSVNDTPPRLSAQFSGKWR